MKKILLIFILLLEVICLKSQNVSREDSAYIYRHFLFYNTEHRTFEDIDEPFIEEFYKKYPEKAKIYYFKAAFLNSIPVEQRVIMISYLDSLKQEQAHKWILKHLRTRYDTIKYFKVLASEYGFPYSKLGISEKEVKMYCPDCKYR